MTISATSDRANSAGRRAPLFVWAWVAWAFFATLAFLHLFLHPGDFFLSSDDTMRLAQMHDLMAGQSWFDTVQSRMNAPFGLTMHWPHFVDAAIATLTFLLRPVFGEHSEMAAVWLWPVLTALPVFLAMARLGFRLAGYEGGILALALTVTCVSVLGIFGPGHIDHHNVQLALSIWMAACLLETERPSVFAMAAFLGTFSLAVGLETLPYVLTSCLLVMSFIVVDGQTFDRPVRRFALMFAASAALLFAIAPASERIVATCDAYSLFYAPIAVVGGLGLASLTLLPATRSMRIGGALALAVVLLALAFITNRECLSGPYSQVDAALQTIWLSRIEEAQPTWSFAFQEPAAFIAGYLYALVCFLATATLCVLSKPSRREAFVLGSLAAAALIVATIEIRGVTFAILLGLPGMAALVIFCLRRVQSSGASRYAQLGLAIVVLLAACDVTYDEVGRFVARRVQPPEISASRDKAAIDCLQRSTLSQLDTLPQGTVAAFVDQGPRILAYSRDSAIAGPYHRDARGIIDTNTIFAGSIAQAAQILKARKVSYVLTCTSSPDHRFYLAESRSGLLAQLDRGVMPGWLQPVAFRDPANVLRLYRVVH